MRDAKISDGHGLGRRGVTPEFFAIIVGVVVLAAVVIFIVMKNKSISGIFDMFP